ncbi:MAG: EamA family transporter [Thermodesulfobacteriota bacterium]
MTLAEHLTYDAAMEIYLGVILGLGAASFWGGADFLAKVVVDRLGPKTSLVYIQGAGLTLALAGLLLFKPAMHITPGGLLLALVPGTLSGAAIICLYRALAAGPASVATPIVASFSLVTVLLSVLFLKERLTGLIAPGILLSVAGVACVSFRASNLNVLRKGIILPGVAPALLGAFFFGTSSFTMKLVVTELGVYLPLLTSKICAVIMVLFLRTPYCPTPWRKTRFIPLLVIVGFLDTAGLLFFNHGIARELVSVVTPLAGVHSALTVVLAMIFLGERLEMNQKLGLLSLLAGVFLLSWK